MRIEQKEIDQAIAENMLEYGVSSIARSLPNNIDGLKSVQRRLLYTLYKNNNGSFRKCMNILGEAMKLIETGDSGAYGALVYMGQEDRHINPTVTSQGNFGCVIDRFDSFAAARYTEAKISQYALDFYFTEDFKYTDWQTSFTGEDEEPIVLPTLLPMGLIQGSKGIGYTVANNVLPLGLKEVAKSYVEYLKLVKDNKNIDSKAKDKLYNILKYKMVNNPNILDEDYSYIFKYGKGTLNTMGDLYVENADYGRQQIVITKLPYMVDATSFIEKLEKLPKELASLISEKHNQSSKGDFRITIILKKDSDPTKLIDYFKLNTNGLFLARTGVFHNYFSYQHKKALLYNVIDMYKEHFEFKKNILDRYFTDTINRLTVQIENLEAVIFIISNKKRLDTFFDILKKSDRKTFVDNLSKTFKELKKSTLEYVSNQQFTIMLKNCDEIIEKVKDLREKLNKAIYNRDHKIEYLINEIETKIRKY